MKRIRFIILLVSVLMCATNAAAQSIRIFRSNETTKLDGIAEVSAAEQGIKIYRTDGSEISLSCEELDSIVAVREPHIEFVDLGLSVKWATCNVGADRPEEYGDYFAWGETSPKSNYCSENNLTHQVELGDISGSSAYDAARSNWGAPARMPSNEEIQELCEKCVWRWKLYRGVHGMLITGPSGNSIFVPASGFRIGDTFFARDENGYYLSSTPFDNINDDAYYLDFDNKFYYHGNWMRRYIGQTVRPVSD